MDRSPRILLADQPEATHSPCTNGTYAASHFAFLRSSKAVPVVSGWGGQQSLHSWLDLHVIFTFCRTKGHRNPQPNWREEEPLRLQQQIKNRGTNKVKDPSDLNNRTWVWTRGHKQLPPAQTPLENQDMHHSTLGNGKLHSYHQHQDTAAPHPGCQQEFWECQCKVQQPPGCLVSRRCVCNSGVCSHLVTALLAG